VKVEKLFGGHLGVEKVSDEDDDHGEDDSNAVDDDVRPHEDKLSEDSSHY